MHHLKVNKPKLIIKKTEIILSIVLIKVILGFIIAFQFYFGILGILILGGYLLFLKLKWHWYFLLIISIILFIFLFLFLSNWNDYRYIYKLINKENKFFYLRNSLFNFLNEKFSKNNLSEFIKLILFNLKTNKICPIWKDLNYLGIAYLFIISGFHLNFLFLVFNFLFLKKLKKTQIIMQFFILVFYGYFIGYSLPILRIFLFKIFYLIYKNSKGSHYLSALFLLFVFSKFSIDFGYLMTFLCVFSILEIIDFKLNKFVQIIIITFICNVLTIPIILYFSKQFNFLAIFYSLLMSPIIAIYYLWLLISFSLFWIESFQNELMKLIILIIGAFKNVPSVIEIEFWNEIFAFFYYFAFFTYLFSKKIFINKI